jgi:hypothetical protein
MKRQLKYERPKLVELTSNELKVGHGQGSGEFPACTNGSGPAGLVCSTGIGPSK